MIAPYNANTSGLAPCPFCGGAPGIRQAMGETWVVCGSCSASTQSKGRESVAFDLWNRRAAPASPLPGGGERYRLGKYIENPTAPYPGGLDQFHDDIAFLIEIPAAPTGEPK